MSKVSKKLEKELEFKVPLRNKLFLPVVELFDNLRKEAAVEMAEEFERQFEESEGKREQTVLEQRMQRIVDLTQLTLGGKGTRYSGPLSIKPWEETENMVLFPKSNKIWNGADGNESGLNFGASCGHFCWSVVSSLVSDSNRSWRTGRQSQLITDVVSKKIKGRTINGYGNYFVPVVDKWTKGKYLGSWLHDNVDKLGRINVIHMSHHVVLCLKFDDEFMIFDPITGEPMPKNTPVEFAANGHYIKRDGKKYYSGKKHTFQPYSSNRTVSQRWKLCRLEGLDDDCQFNFGSVKNAVLKPIVLEGLEHITDRTPTLEDAKEAGLF